VVALDNGSKELWTFPEYLKQHPLITFLSADIKDCYPDNDQTFDLIKSSNFPDKFFDHKLNLHTLPEL